MLSEEMEKDGIDEDEWPTEAQIKWQNKQSRPKETGEFNNPLSNNFFGLFEIFIPAISSCTKSNVCIKCLVAII